VLAEAKAASPLIRIGNVARSSAECEPRHERARLDGDDGDAGGRAVLSLSCARARRGSCWDSLVDRSARRRADRCSSRSHCGPFWRTTHDHRWAHRSSGRFLHSGYDTGDARHLRLHRPHRGHHRRLCAVPDGQQHRRHDRYPPGPAGRHFRHAQPVAQSRAHHRCIRYGRCVRARIGDHRHHNGASRGCCRRHADHVRGGGDCDRRRARHRGWKPCSRNTPFAPRKMCHDASRTAVPTQTDPGGAGARYVSSSEKLSGRALSASLHGK